MGSLFKIPDWLDKGATTLFDVGTLGLYGAATGDEDSYLKKARDWGAKKLGLTKDSTASDAAKKAAEDAKILGREQYAQRMQGLDKALAFFGPVDQQMERLYGIKPAGGPNFFGGPPVDPNTGLSLTPGATKGTFQAPGAPPPGPPVQFAHPPAKAGIPTAPINYFQDPNKPKSTVSVKNK